MGPTNEALLNAANVARNEGDDALANALMAMLRRRLDMLDDGPDLRVTRSGDFAPITEPEADAITEPPELLELLDAKDRVALGLIIEGSDGAGQHARVRSRLRRFERLGLVRYTCATGTHLGAWYLTHSGHDCLAALAAR